jgi:hypothetical protein
MYLPNLLQFRNLEMEEMKRMSKNIIVMILLINLFFAFIVSFLFIGWKINVGEKKSAAESDNICPSILLVIYPDGWNEYNIVPFLMYLGVTFDIRLNLELKPADVFVGARPKYKIIMVYYASVGSDIAKVPAKSEFKNAILWAAGNGSTIVINDFVTYWFQSELDVHYTKPELSNQNVTVVFHDNTVTSALIDRFGRVYASKQFSGTIFAVGSYDSYKDLIFLASVPYINGKFLVVNTAIMRLLWQRASDNYHFYEKMLKIIENELNEKIFFSFYGWSHGKQIAIAVRYDDIFPMEYPKYVDTIKKIDSILAKAGLVATYGVTAFGSGGWNDTNTAPHNNVTLVTGFPEGYSGNIPRSCWHATLKYENTSFIFFDSNGDGKVDRMRVDINYDKYFSLEEEFMFNETFGLGPYKMVWTNLDNPFQPTNAYISLANQFLDQYDDTLITHMKNMIEKFGFKVVPHGIWHWRNQAWGEPCEYYFSATFTPIPTHALIQKLNEAYSYLAGIFGDQNVGKVNLLPWGASTKEVRAAIKELGWILGGDIVISKYGQPNIGAKCIDNMCDEDILRLFIGFNVTRGYLVAMNHPFSNSVEQYQYLTELYDTNRQLVWSTDLVTIGEFARDRWYTLNLTQNTMYPTMLHNKNRLILEYWTPLSHKDYVVRLHCKPSSVLIVEANRSMSIIGKDDEWIYLEVKEGGPIRIRLDLSSSISDYLFSAYVSHLDGIDILFMSALNRSTHIKKKDMRACTSRMQMEVLTL